MSGLVNDNGTFLADRSVQTEFLNESQNPTYGFFTTAFAVIGMPPINLLAINCQFPPNGRDLLLLDAGYFVNPQWAIEWMDADIVLYVDSGDFNIGTYLPAFNGDDAIRGNSYSDTVKGGNGSDDLYGNGGNDVLYGEAGNDVLNGGLGYDIAAFSGTPSNYDIGKHADGTRYVIDNTGRDGWDRLVDIEVIRFENPSVYRFYHKGLGTHFYTTSADERDMIVRVWSDVYAFEGTAFHAAHAPSGPGNGISGVFRFYNTKVGTHFFTTSAAERDMVMAKWSDTCAFEGTSYFASETDHEGFTPVYRFYNTRQGSHFYTVSDAERASVNANYGHIFHDEGVAYYVPATAGTDMVL